MRLILLGLTVLVVANLIVTVRIGTGLQGFRDTVTGSPLAGLVTTLGKITG